MLAIGEFENNIICFHGTINIDLISFTSNYMKQQINTNNIVIGKIYKVFIELTQNVSYYSADQNDSSRTFGSGKGWFKVDEEIDSYIITTGNKILKEHGSVLIKNSHEINSLNEDDLRELKRKTRSQAGIKDIGAHIGLIQTGLITSNQIRVNIEPIDNNYSLFTISAKVNKC
jgi:Family of unknown function (DUF6272)